jgi:CheY-like chemotaxis protein
VSGAESDATKQLGGQEKVNILVVDDLEEKHIVFRSILEELGQNIVSARSASSARRSL